MRSEFEEHNAKIVGISADQVDRQLEFDQRNSLSFPLLSDPDRKVAKQFGVARFGPLPSKRATFVIDVDRRILGAITSETNMHHHADEALKALAKRGTGDTA